MPTYNRRKFIESAIQYFLRQDYANKELIILDDGTDCIKDLVPIAKNIRYYRFEKKLTLGAKLNLGCEYARGGIIANWDDDDWYAPWRLSYQLRAMQNETIELCGINNLYYYDFSGKNGYQYIYPSSQRVWIIGSSQCYTKELWKKNKFADINVGMDGLFVWATPVEKVKVLEDSTFAVHMIHPHNVSPKKTEGHWWHPFPIEEIKTIMGTDWGHYADGDILPQTKLKNENANKSSLNNQSSKLLKNVYACLVHEKEDCIIDLVRNLHYHDPSSHIILYNGSEGNNLNEKQFDYEQFSAVWHPFPKPQKHGYLHGFALDCMNFAIDNFTFDTLTIVDSDQLAIRSEYSKFLSVFFSDKTNVGMLSSNPRQITPKDRHHHVALQAFKEYDLWKPFLQLFPDGERKFVHWTFWPSTVFSFPAVKDLTQLFYKNKLLKEIMKKTKIWATEEVIFPTLVKLLGYAILANPCSYDYVKYKVKFNVRQLERALRMPNVFWLHPVDRVYENPLRKYTRQHFQHYIAQSAKPELKASDETIKPLNILDKIKSVQGWLSDKEANLLMTITLKAGEILEGSFVEIGSYHGKATIILGTVAKEKFPEVKVISIDPHDGRLGAIDQGLHFVPPSFSFFKSNIKKAKLTEIVEIHKSNSWDVKWNSPVALLLIDGLHDYPSVARDFGHFSEWISPGGYIVFHDYADYFPGVMAFVDELLISKNYLKVNQADSLIVLKKREAKA